MNYREPYVFEPGVGNEAGCEKSCCVGCRLSGGEIIGHHWESYTQPNCPADLPEGDGIGHAGGEDSIESR